jgi:hypothetical protein
MYNLKFPVDTVTIEVEKWYSANNPYIDTSEISYDPSLNNGLGQKCCLGFIMRDLLMLIGNDVHTSNDMISIHPSPESVNFTLLDEISNLSSHKTNLNMVVERGTFIWGGETVRNSKLSNDAIEINDNMDMSFYKKMTELKELFAMHNIRLRFVRHGWIEL